MIKKIVKKVNEVGIVKTFYLIKLRIFSFFQRKINFLNNKKNFLFCEKKSYWFAYNYIKRKYLKDLMIMKKKSNTNQYSNKVWWCWLQGEKNCPDIQKKCLESLRKKLYDREIIVIDNDNLFDYISLPEYIVSKHKKGIISNTHFSDLIRLQLLIKYGGTWIDSTALCSYYDKTLFDLPLFVFKNVNNIWYANKFKFDQEPILADNWFITSEINNPILIAVRDLLFKYWEEHDYLVDYFIFHYFFSMVVSFKYYDQFYRIPTRSHLIPHLLQYEYFNKYDNKVINDILKQSSFHKLTNKVEINKIRHDCFYKLLLDNDKVVRKELYEQK